MIMPGRSDCMYISIRLPKKLILTAAGEVLIGHIRQTLKELTRAQAKIEELKGLRRR